MDESKFPQPTSAQLDGFVNGDPIAIQESIELLLPPLIRWAKSNYAGLAADEVESLMHQVFGEVCINHDRYDRKRSKLTTYILNLFKLRVRDLLQQAAENKKLISLDADIKYEKSLATPYNYTDEEEQNISVQRFFEQVEQYLEPLEIEFLGLMRSGVKDSERFVTILLNHRTDVNDLTKEVKNTKERLYRKIRTIADELNVVLTDLF
ncbi:MAG: hypothetical protein K8L97_31215 [Anaerolineae bacterium]|nr:hypothetical protein [Anaerolineae bacterium]